MVIVSYEMDDAYRAIGRYVVDFSELVRVMRELAAEYVAGGTIGSHLGHMLLGEATAGVIANAFFGLCRLEGEFDADEEKVASAMIRAVMDVIQARNDIAHGDWWVGLFSFSTPSGPGESIDPRLVRIRPGRAAGPRDERDLAVGDIDALTEGVRRLTNLVDEFGKLALKLPLFRSDPDGSSHVSTGEFRVRDVLTTTRAGRNRPARVTRGGPHAASIHPLNYAWPYTSSMRKPRRPDPTSNRRPEVPPAES